MLIAAGKKTFNICQTQYVIESRLKKHTSAHLFRKKTRIKIHMIQAKIIYTNLLAFVICPWSYYLWQPTIIGSQCQLVHSDWLLSVLQTKDQQRTLLS